MTFPLRSDGDPGALLPLWEIQQTARLAARLLEQALQQAGITTAEYGVLACVSDEPGLTQADVARRLQIRPQAITATITKLGHRNFIKGDQNGRGNRSSLQITNDGRSALNEAWPHIIELNSPTSLGISQEYAESLCTDLEHLRHALSQREAEPVNERSSDALTG